MKKLLLLSIVLLAACVHKPNIEQGNIISPTQVSQLHTGMTDDEVKALLGNPIMDQPFNQNRLEYVYTLQKGRKKGSGTHLSLLFKDHKLVSIQHDPSFPLTD